MSSLVLTLFVCRLFPFRWVFVSGLGLSSVWHECPYHSMVSSGIMLADFSVATGAGPGAATGGTVVQSGAILAR